MLRLGIMLVGIVVLVAGVLGTIALVSEFLFGGIDLFPPDVTSWDVSPRGTILGMATACGLVAFAGWAVFVHGRYGPSRAKRTGRHRHAGRDGSGGDGGGYSDDSDGGAGDGGGGGD